MGILSRVHMSKWLLLNVLLSSWVPVYAIPLMRSPRTALSVERVLPVRCGEIKIPNPLKDTTLTVVDHIQLLFGWYDLSLYIGPDG